MSYVIDPAIHAFREKFEALHPDSKLDEMDWLRCSFALRFVTGDSALEVGPGVGMILQALDERGLELSALDLGPHSKAMYPEGLELQEGSITNPNLAIPSRSTVICMEVLEHLEASANKIALANLREAAKDRLIMTVPYNEREPLWHFDKPGGHRQRFTIDKAAELFPHAYATILPRYDDSWLFMIEDRNVSAPFFSLVSRDRICELFGAK